MMCNIQPNLHNEFVDYDEIIRITIFHTKEIDGSSKHGIQECNHLGYLVKDGHNISSTGIAQRYLCKNCKKRFGSETNEWRLYEYQYKLKEILYEIFFEGCGQTKMEKRWGIPQPKISQFKHYFVDTLFEQHPGLVISDLHELPLGVIYGDETYMGKMGNSNTEIVFCNDKFEILAAGPVEINQQQVSILKTFLKIPEECRKKVRIIVSDGEPSYQILTLLNDHRITLVQQYHSHKKLGQITIHKYQKFGPHYLHYHLHTHWKIFKKGKHELSFRWEIKLVKSKLPMGRGRPTIQMKNSKVYQQWRQKIDQYHSGAFQKHGSAKLFINPETKKVTLRQGSKRWMRNMIQTIFPIYHNKCITNNRVESKHSQIKRTGKMRKQPSLLYSDRLFLLQEYILQNEHLPLTYLKNRPLYNYIMDADKKERIGYVFRNNDKKITQKFITGYL